MMADVVGNQIEPGSAFEVRLLGGGQDQMVFVTCKEDDTAALSYANALLVKHPQFRRAEVWRGMTLVGNLDGRQ